MGRLSEYDEVELSVILPATSHLSRAIRESVADERGERTKTFGIRYGMSREDFRRFTIRKAKQ